MLRYPVIQLSICLSSYFSQLNEFEKNYAYLIFFQANQELAGTKMNSSNRIVILGNSSFYTFNSIYEKHFLTDLIDTSYARGMISCCAIKFESRAINTLFVFFLFCVRLVELDEFTDLETLVLYYYLDCEPSDLE